MGHLIKAPLLNACRRCALRTRCQGLSKSQLSMEEVMEKYGLSTGSDRASRNDSLLDLMKLLGEDDIEYTHLKVGSDGRAGGAGLKS
jgi:hypothetical protein